ncbi:MAG: hypothetical protein ACYC7D_03510 [Nitrososphaerales archaeon]
MQVIRHSSFVYMTFALVAIASGALGVIQGTEAYLRFLAILSFLKAPCPSTYYYCGQQAAFVHLSLQSEVPDLILIGLGAIVASVGVGLLFVEIRARFSIVQSIL